MALITQFLIVLLILCRNSLCYICWLLNMRDILILGRLIS